MMADRSRFIKTTSKSDDAEDEIIQQTGDDFAKRHRS